MNFNIYSYEKKYVLKAYIYYKNNLEWDTNEKEKTKEHEYDLNG